MGNIINFNQKMEENKMASEDTEKMVEEISTAFWSFYEEKASKIEEFLQKNKISIEFVPLGKITPIWDNEYEYTLYSVIMKNDTTNIVSFNYYDDSNLNINNEGDELILLCNIFENFSIGKYKDFSEKSFMKDKDFEEHLWNLYINQYIQAIKTFGKSFMDFVEEIQEN